MVQTVLLPKNFSNFVQMDKFRSKEPTWPQKDKFRPKGQIWPQKDKFGQSNGGKFRSNRQIWPN